MIRIPENTTIVGELRSSGEVRVDGRFQGEGNIDGILLLTQTCVWVGKAIADIIVVEGIIEGDVIARKKLLVGPHARIRGSIKTPVMKIAKGAKLRCHIDMHKMELPTGLLEHKPVAEKNITDELAEYRNKTRKTA
ncbi:MAG: polymer-forming cytoskeletal protein [Gammaproteobacteria bacterium]|nr:polymer-forming cytoskeletal protein [Gammaproteobacteria bacterium]